MNFLNHAQNISQEIISWRRHIHQNAELSFCEHNTQAYIESILDEYKIAHTRVAGTGVLAKLNNGSGGKVAVLRADIDALEINEQTGLDFACNNNRMHACGHDMHAAALLGALILLKNSDTKKEIWGLFQPGEEVHPGGASIVLSEGIFNGIEIDYFLALHCSPELPCGTIGVRSGQFMASTDELHITVNGVGGHGAMPHLAKDSVLAASAIVVAMQQINARNNWALNPSVISFGRFIAEGATNVLPESVLLEGTFRTMDEAWRAQAKTRIEQVAQHTANAYGCTANIEIKDGYPSVYNNPELVELFKKSTADIANIIEIDKRMTAEDFGFYSQVYPSLMFRLGVGSDGHGGALHTAGFNPDESALAIGSSALANFAYTK